MLDKYNWNSISFENIFPVCVCEQDLGKRKHAFGETKFYQLGMKFEGVARSAICVNGIYRDVGTCAILREEFKF